MLFCQFLNIFFTDQVRDAATRREGEVLQQLADERKAKAFRLCQQREAAAGISDVLKSAAAHAQAVPASPDLQLLVAGREVSSHLAALRQQRADAPAAPDATSELRFAMRSLPALLDAIGKAGFAGGGPSAELSTLAGAGLAQAVVGRDAAFSVALRDGAGEAYASEGWEGCVAVALEDVAEAAAAGAGTGAGAGAGAVGAEAVAGAGEGEAPAEVFVRGGAVAGTCEVTYRPRAGRGGRALRLHVTTDGGQHVAGSPFEVRVSEWSTAIAAAVPHARCLEEWVGSPPCSWELLYRGSRDGFGAAAFHSRCDGKADTVTLVQATNGSVFGGFVDTAWSSVNDWHASTTAFLFSLVQRGAGSPMRCNVTNHKQALYHSASYGPVFGSGHDLYIASDCNMNSTSHTNLSCYQAAPSGGAHALTGGDDNFQVSEIEVYRRV